MTLDLQKASLQDLFRWVGAESDQDRKKEKYYFLTAKTVMGGGSEEDRLIRLMIWVGTTLPSGPVHSRIAQPLEILKDGKAWCDQHTKVFAFFAWFLLGIPVRELGLRHNDGHNGHTVCEAQYGGGWHLFDVHGDHLAVYRNPENGILMDWEALSRCNNPLTLEGHWWKGSNEVGKRGFYDPGSPPEYCKIFSHYTANQKLPWDI